jgi:hypothetical protein
MRVIKALLATFCGFGMLQAAQFCNLSFTGCPSQFSSINVPKDVIWLDPKIPFCSETVKVQTGGTSPLTSIVFIIDNSGSMDQNDQFENRFSVTTRLLDSIYAVAPNTEVGIVIFTRRLSFDHRENPFFHTAFPGDTTQHDSFIPLTPLNKQVGAVRGIDTLKALLSHDDEGNLTYHTNLPDPRPSSNAQPLDPLNVRDGTDITLGFDAAKVAMGESHAASKNDQYFIFLSDGQPSSPDTPRVPRINEFQDGAATPTTFTVFFKQTRRDEVPTAPQSIITMTDNIKANGYSASNPKSQYWALNPNTGDLLSLLQGSVLNPIFSNLSAKPLSAIRIHGADRDSTAVIDPKNFVFPDRIPLDPGQTKVELQYTYTYKDSAGVTQTLKKNYTLNINRTNATNYPDSATTASCYDPGDIKLYSDGQVLNVVTADNDSVEVRLTPPGGSCSNCSVGVTPSKSKNDSENVSLTQSSGYYGGILHRHVDNSPTPLNGTLEHLPSDSIVVTYVNPENPLETIRKAFPYNDINTTLSTGPLQFDFDKRSKAEAVELPVRDEKIHWVVAGNQGVKLEETSKPDAWQTLDPNRPEFSNDQSSSLSNPGVRIEASRSFHADVWVYSNLGELVDKYSFNLPQLEFDKLPKGNKQNTRVLKIYWVPKSLKGRKAGTGAYIMKYVITLNTITGVAEDEKVSSDVKILGYIRPSGS